MHDGYDFPLERFINPRLKVKGVLKAVSDSLPLSWAPAADFETLTTLGPEPLDEPLDEPFRSSYRRPITMCPLVLIYFAYIVE